MPGDLLSTGSPPGNGASHGNRWLRPGDVVTSELTYLGRRKNNVVAEEKPMDEPILGDHLALMTSPDGKGGRGGDAHFL